MPVDLRVKLGAPYFNVAVSATEVIRVRSPGDDDGGENGACEVIHVSSWRSGQVQFDPMALREAFYPT
jgi:hypothetical protein